MDGYSLVVDPHDGDGFIRAVGGDDHLTLDAVAVWSSAHAVAH